MRNDKPAKSRYILIAVPFVWLGVFFLIPFGIVAKIALSDAAIARPPYTPTFGLSKGWEGFVGLVSAFDLENFVWLTEEALYWKSYLSSLEIASISTVLTLAVGFPIAYGMSRAKASWRPTLVMLIILPFWTSFLIRVYAWIGILKKEGLLNLALTSLGLVDEPLTILNTNVAVYIGIVYSYLPFMVLPIYASLERLDDSLLEAAYDLGCTRISAFWTVTLPLAIPGVLAGALLVFIPAVGEFVIPDLLGGSDTLMIGKTLWVEFFSNRDWPVAAAVAVVLLALLVVPIVLFQRVQERNAGLVK
ncbi:MAG: ABC transporter permease subunit [Gammaproteobacteria bacterium]|nr:ABC transporter permease subunit [Gammaproteobacteria bacterium]